MKRITFDKIVTFVGFGRVLDAAHDDLGGVVEGAVPVEHDQVKTARRRVSHKRQFQRGWLPAASAPTRQAAQPPMRCARRWPDA